VIGVRMADSGAQKLLARWRSWPIVKWPIAIVVLVVLAVIGALSGSSSTSGSSSGAAGTTATSHTPAPVFSGLGATASAWSSAHPSDGEGDYGPRVTSGGSTVTEFQTVSEDGGRVDGFDVSLSDETSLAQAKSSILALLPPDTKSTSWRIAPAADGSGPCALWNLQSQTLGRLFAPKTWGDPQGQIGVSLSTTNADGTESYDTSNVNTATVGLAWSTPTVSC